VEEEFSREMERLGATVTVWENDPHYTYAPHSHPYKKVLVCVAGSITFHTECGDQTLAPGDRLVLEPGTVHSAEVGPSGVRCAEAHLAR